MSATRLTLLCAFAGGCLSNAVLFGLWRVADSAGAPAVKQLHSPHDVADLLTPAIASSAKQPSELVAANGAQEQHQAPIQPAPDQPPQDFDRGTPTPAGSAVSDVLTRLESAYRERVAAGATAQASDTFERPSAAAVTAVASTRVAELPVAPSAAVPIAVAPIAVAPIAVAPIAVAPVPVAPAQVALPEAIPAEVAAVPASALTAARGPTEIHYGDVNQNTYVTNIRQGDVYLVQLQQLAALQYLQLLGLPSSTPAAPARRVAHVGGALAQRAAFPSGITNPDNPWGFHFAPLNLVR